jgi:hypothetical protein
MNSALISSTEPAAAEASTKENPRLPLQPFENSVVAHGFLDIAVTREHSFVVSRQTSQRVQDLQRLCCQRHNMRSSHLHSFGGYIPAGSFESNSDHFAWINSLARRNVRP